MLEYPIFKSKAQVPNLFWRPPLQLRSLPVESRWEATRRHPSYFTYWKPADATCLFDDAGKAAEAQLAINAARVIALNAIGVPPEEAIDPAIEFLDLGELNQAWKSGAVHPTSMRGLASLLVTCLPQETLASLGAALIEAACDDNSIDDLTLPKKIQALNKIAAMDKAGLDHLTPEPFVSVNPWASGRQVGRELSLLLNQWKEELDLTEVRERSEKHKSYFKVWDRREGWRAGRYQPGEGKRFVEISEELELPLTTVHSQYKKAFEIITGHTYRFNSFLELFGLIRFSRLFSDGRDAKHRRFLDSTTHPVSETTVGIPLETANCDPNETTATSTYTPADFVADFKSLSDRGMSDTEAAAELGVEVTDSLNQLLDLYRMR